MSTAWIAIMPVVVLTVVLASVLIFFIAKNNQKNSHKTIDPKPTENFKTTQRKKNWSEETIYITHSLISKTNFTFKTP